MSNYYLAIDIGASSGRHILGHLKDGLMVLEEVYRFENGMIQQDGSLLWDHGRIFGEILNGLKACKALGRTPVSVSVDTWGVDYVLLDENDTVIEPTYAYRDHRTDDAPELVGRLISDKELYLRTGIQKMQINTIYQLYTSKIKEPEKFAGAGTLLFSPDYYHYLLSGEKLCEYTIASTSQLLDVRTGGWDYELIEKLGLDPKIFLDPAQPGTRAGSLLPGIAEQIGYSCDVVLPASHDTASAIMAIPDPDPAGRSIYISSGTWSLMGCELPEPLTSEESRKHNFTNEGGYNRRYRYLHNIMGLWMIQSVRNELGKRYSFDELCDMAAASDIPSLVDCEDARFLAPESMTDAIQGYCAETDQQIPKTPGELAAVIYNSLAATYRDAISSIKDATGRKYDAINVLGGGSKAAYLNELTAKATGLDVYAGPAEATAIGNIIAQMITAGELKDLKEARKCVAKSFEIEHYSPV
ncbi:MAG: rhamnulokinase [Clostridiales Family XIII bacterium]|jgi:rhamnulokinase|nr:rhamnulokinase [Clostridiales Family XIII bacterium]